MWFSKKAIKRPFNETVSGTSTNERFNSYHLPDTFSKSFHQKTIGALQYLLLF
jgi:hypothetical protein